MVNNCGNIQGLDLMDTKHKQNITKIHIKFESFCKQQNTVECLK